VNKGCKNGFEWIDFHGLIHMFVMGFEGYDAAVFSTFSAPLMDRFRKKLVN